MAITFNQLEKHLYQPDKWQGYENCIFEVRLMSVQDALNCQSAWAADDAHGAQAKVSMRDYVRNRVALQRLNDAATVLSYAGAFKIGPVVLVAFPLDTMAALWGAGGDERYAWGVGNQELVIWDGHHRLAALAIREMLGIADDNPVVVFVGQLIA